MAAQSVLHLLMSLSYKEDIIFIQNGASSLRTSHAAHTFPFLNRLNSLHELSNSSWTLTGDARLTPDPVTQSISEVRLCLLSHSSLSGPTSAVVVVCPPTQGMVWFP